MRAWIVRSGMVESGPTAHVPTITLKTRRSVGIKQGDAILGSENPIGKVRFVWQARAGDISARPLSELKRDVDPNLKLYSIQLAEHQALEPARELEDLQYSLQKVWRLDRPNLHFRQPYTRISEEDLGTILGDRIFWARTALLRFLMALPEVLRAEIVTEQVLPSRVDGQFGYRVRWRHFRQHLEASFLPLAELFHGIEDELLQLGALAPPEAYFRDDAEDRPDSIREQATRFREFAASLDMPAQRSLLDAIDAHIEENSETERRFERLFESTPWPPAIRKR